MKLNDEEQDILAGKAARIQLALDISDKSANFFAAQDFVTVTQATSWPTTESLGEAGVRWLENWATQSDGRARVRIRPSQTHAAPISPRPRSFARMLDARLGTASHRGLRKAWRFDDRHLHPLSDYPGTDAQ